MIKGQHSKNDGEEKILRFMDIIEHLYPNQDYLSPDSCCKRKSIPFLKVTVHRVTYGQTHINWVAIKGQPNRMASIHFPVKQFLPTCACFHGNL